MVAAVLLTCTFISVSIFICVRYRKRICIRCATGKTSVFGCSIFFSDASKAGVFWPTNSIGKAGKFNRKCIRQMYIHTCEVAICNFFWLLCITTFLNNMSVAQFLCDGWAFCFYIGERHCYDWLLQEMSAAGWREKYSLVSFYHWRTPIPLSVYIRYIAICLDLVKY